MTDERIDALIRRLDVPSDPDPDFVRSTYASLRPRARTARVADASRLGRFRRDLRLELAGLRWPSTVRPVGLLRLVVLLILATIVALAIAGALKPPIQNGPLIVSMHGELRAIDTVDGSARPILPPGDYALGLSRSPDGRLVSFWTIGSKDRRSHLYVVGVDGQHRRELASELSLGWAEAVDVWSSDSRSLAAAVLLDGLARIVVADVDTGTARVVTPPGLGARDPLWSPDDRWIAFTKLAGTATSLAIIRTDGSDIRTISGDLVNAGGPDTWSPDGAWIYFGVAGGIYRANVAGGFTQLLTGDDLMAYAPTSSPDGTLVSFMVARRNDHWDLFVANSDGTNAHRLLEYAENNGWSPDGRYVLAQWNPTDQPGGLAIVRPDGSEFRVVLPFDALCPPQPGRAHVCTDGIGWGQPKP
jgi:dipeptidyl aminopeptidase/acylaminoacyl peptidase